jgi:hypothetical protein
MVGERTAIAYLDRAPADIPRWLSRDHHCRGVQHREHLIVSRRVKA